MSLGSLTLAPSIRFLIDEYSFRGGILILSGLISHVFVAASLMRPPEFYDEWRKLKEKTATDSDKKDTIPVEDSDSGNSYESVNKHKDSKSKKLDEKRENIVKKEYFYESSEIPNASNKPTTREREKKSVFSFVVFKNGHFVIFVTAYFFGCVGQGLPIIYIPDIANDNNIDKKYSAMLVSIAGACDVIGRSSMGILSDRKHVDRKNLIFISMLITGVADHLIRYFNQLWSLILFSVIYGLFGSTIAALYSPVLLDTLPLKHLRSGLCVLQIGQCISWAIANQVSGNQISVYSLRVFMPRPERSAGGI